MSTIHKKRRLHWLEGLKLTYPGSATDRTRNSSKLGSRTTGTKLDSQKARKQEGQKEGRKAEGLKAGEDCTGAAAEIVSQPHCAKKLHPSSTSYSKRLDCSRVALETQRAISQKTIILKSR